MSAAPDNFFHTDLEPDRVRLRAALADDSRALRVICYCAAWCQGCTGYLPALQALAADWPAVPFIWVDIEHRPEWLGDTDVEDFPTLLLQDGEGNRFFGPLPARIEHLQRLLERPPRALAAGGPPSLATLLLAADTP